MPYDAALTDRMRRALSAHRGISEKRMMGGVCFLYEGHMISGARRDTEGVARFMFRVGKAAEAAALADPAAHPVHHGARRLGGFIHVHEADCDDQALTEWLARCLDHARSLPPKPGKDSP